MVDDPKNPEDDSPVGQLDELERSAETGDMSPKEQFQKTSHIALLLTYDLIDKLRYWEKVTLDLPDDEIAERLDHLTRSVAQLRDAYLNFTELDF